MGGIFNSPNPPNPNKVAAAQGAVDKGTAIAQAGLNNTNQVTPQGNLTYAQIGTWPDGTPRFQATTSLTPTGQSTEAQNQANQLAGSQLAGSQLSKLGGILGSNFALGATPQQGGINLNNNLSFADNPSLSNQAIENKIVGLQQQRLDPQWAQRGEVNQATLADQGIVPGTEAYDRAMTNFNQAQNDAYNQMYLGAQGQIFGQQAQARGMANQEDTATFGAGNQTTAQEAQFNNNAQTANWQQQIQDALLQRNQPINEITALMSGSQVSQPNFVNTPQTQVPDNTNFGQYYNNQYQAQLGQQNALLGGLGGIGGAAAQGYFGGTWNPSDRRLKKNVHSFGALGKGINLYGFEYKKSAGLGEDRHLGVMAQEVEKQIPDAVREMDNGFKSVDYARVLEGLEAR